MDWLLGAPKVVEAGTECDDWAHDEQPVDSWYDVWLTVPPLQDAHPEQEAPQPELQSLQPQLCEHAVVHTGRMLTCCVQELHGEHEPHDEHELGA